MATLKNAVKKHLSDLAILGGDPVFSDKQCVGKPNVVNAAAFMSRVEGILDRNWLTNDGPCVQEFEREIERRTGARHCIAVCNATAGLELLLRALDLKGEVIVPSFTFIATAHAVKWCGLTPIFCDIDPETHNLDPVQAAKLITEKTTAIMGVHVWGRPCDVDRLDFLAKRNGLKLIFDAAHAFGCSIDATPIANFGIAEVFSFHATKFINSLEGGAICTNDGDLAQTLRNMRNFGFAGLDDVQSLGTNAKMNEVCAAMGLTNLQSIGQVVQTNESNYETYREGLNGIPGVSLICFDPADSPNYQYVVIEIDEREFGMSRDELSRVLWAENILARRYFYPGCHQQEPYSSDGTYDIRNTERLCSRVLTLPTGLAVRHNAIETICEVVRFAQVHASEFAAPVAQAA
jgi:dTDP-4-amino-4,6-dideoxygalactose transaminase